MKTPQRLLALAMLCLSPFVQAALPNSGTCGFVVSVGSPVLSGGWTATSGAISHMGTLTFSQTGIALKLNSAIQNARSQPVTADTVAGSDPSCTIKSGHGACVTSEQFSANLTPSAMTGNNAPSGAYTMTDTASGVTLNLLPVNNGLTLLMQFYSADYERTGGASVCQF